MKNEKYLSMDENGTLTDGKIKDMNNCFKTQKEAAQKSYQWQVMRLNNKNLYPYRDFMQFDSAWAKKIMEMFRITVEKWRQQAAELWRSRMQYMH